MDAQTMDLSMQELETFNQHYGALFGLAYRMLGSVMDAEDVLQEAFLQWQQTDTSTINTPKAYLVTMVTRLCIDHLRLARVQREQYIGNWLPEPLLTPPKGSTSDPVELADSLTTAFLLLLERLTPVDRAVFLLHDAFGYTYEEIASIVERTPADCRQIGHRARTKIMSDHARFTADIGHVRQVTQQFIDACTNGDMQGLLALLTEDITLWSDSGGKVQAARNIIMGADHVARFLLGVRRKAVPCSTMRMIEGDGQIAVVEYVEGRAKRVTTFVLREGQIGTIYRILNPDKLRHIPPLTQ